MLDNIKVLYLMKRNNHDGVAGVCAADGHYTDGWVHRWCWEMREWQCGWWAI